MTLIPVAVTVGALAAGGLLWYGQANAAPPLELGDGPDTCYIFYADGTPHGWGDMSKRHLELAAKDVRRTPTGWIVVLHNRPVRTVYRDVTHTGAGTETVVEYAPSGPVSDLSVFPLVADPSEIRDATYRCIIEPGDL